MKNKEIIDLSEGLDIILKNEDIFGPINFIKNNDELIDTIKNNKEDRVKNYIKRYEINGGDYIGPILYTINKDFVIKHDFYYSKIEKTIFDKKNKLIASYQIDNLNKNLLEIKTNHIHYKKKENYFEEDIFEIKINSIKKVVMVNETTDNKIVLKKRKGITEVSFFEKTIEVKFINCTYSKIVFNNNLSTFNIYFSNSTKKNLEVKDLININSYEEALESFKENVELYNLREDSNYKFKSNKEDFKKHLSLLKQIINNKEDILNITKNIKNEVEMGLFEIDKELLTKDNFNRLFTIKNLKPNTKVENSFRRDLVLYYHYMNILINAKDTNKIMDLDIVNKIVNFKNIENKKTILKNNNIPTR